MSARRRDSPTRRDAKRLPWPSLARLRAARPVTMLASCSSVAGSHASHARLCSRRGCNRPRYISGGIEHGYCGRTHANEDYAEATGKILPPPHGSCHICKLEGCNRPVCFEEDTQRVHDFCSRTHADAAIQRGLHPPSNKQLCESDPTARCSLYGCSAPRFYDSRTGILQDYCGRSHAKRAQEQGQQPHPADILASGAPNAFCQTFRGRPGGEEYTISALTNAHPKYEQIKAQFVASWASAPVPTVLRVWQVRNTHSCWSRYRRYREEVAAASSNNSPHEERRFHGTKMKCNFGIDITQKPCNDQDCNVCAICETGFNLDYAANGPRTQQFSPLKGNLRYDAGLYFSRTSSKSNDYAGTSERALPSGRQARIMFLCRVVLGNELRTKLPRLNSNDIDVQLRARGNGGRYDSVTGLTAADGGALNYEENVVYDNRAAIPSYLIVYQLP